MTVFQKRNTYSRLSRLQKTASLERNPGISFLWSKTKCFSLSLLNIFYYKGNNCQLSFCDCFYNSVLIKFTPKRVLFAFHKHNHMTASILDNINESRKRIFFIANSPETFLLKPSVFHIFSLFKVLKSSNKAAGTLSHVKSLAKFLSFVQKNDSVQ